MKNDYAAAMRELEQLHSEGKIDQAAYELHKAKLLAEASKPVRPLSFRIALFVVIVLGLVALLHLLTGCSQPGPGEQYLRNWADTSSYGEVIENPVKTARVVCQEIPVLSEDDIVSGIARDNVDTFAIARMLDRARTDPSDSERNVDLVAKAAATEFVSTVRASGYCQEVQ